MLVEKMEQYYAPRVFDNFIQVFRKKRKREAFASTDAKLIAVLINMNHILRIISPVFDEKNLCISEIQLLQSSSRSTGRYVRNDVVFM